MICKECNKEMQKQKQLHFIDGFWYFIPTFICTVHGSVILKKDIISENIVTPQKSIRKFITRGLHVKIILKKDQPTGVLTEGYVQDILTNSPEHWRGIKVRLTDGQVGRVQEFLP
jgi:uncharacterized repeat protein (TIGR03833 family)